MNKKIFQILFFLIVIIAFAVVIKSFVDSITSDINEYSHILDTQPKSNISRLSPITINLAQYIDDNKYQINRPIDDEIISFNPSIEGYTYFTDKRTIEFQPNKPLPVGVSFRGKLNVNKLFPSVRLKPFYFKFSTSKLTFKVTIDEIIYYDSVGDEFPYISGNITFNDYVEFSKIPVLINAYQNNIKLPINFIPSSNYQSIKFLVNRLERHEKEERIIVKWKGESIDSKTADSTVVKIASIDSFKMVNYSLSYFPKPVLKIIFTDIIKKVIQPDSLIKISQLNDYKIDVSNNEIIIHFNKITNQTHRLSISKLLQSSSGNELESDFNLMFQLVDPKPLVHLRDSSHYKSTFSDANFIDVKAFNFSSLTVEVTHIPDNNMIQFLQVNSISGNKELKRVGKSIFKKTFDLQLFPNYSPDKLTNYSLSLLGANLAKSGLYNFSFKYNSNNVVYCDSTQLTDSNLVKNIYHNTEIYNHNYIFSDLHVVAKRTSMDTLYIFVSNKVTGEPVKQSQVEIFDFQQKRHALLLTDDNGVAKVKIDEQDLFVRVKLNNQISYLRINSLNKVLKNSEDIRLVELDKGVMFYISGLKSKYTSSDSLQVGIVLKKSGKFNLEKKNLKIKLETPNHDFINTQVLLVSSSAIELYKVKLPFNIEAGVWRLVISYGEAELKYPFVVANKYDYLFNPSSTTQKIQNASNSNKAIFIDTENQLLTNNLPLVNISTNKLSYTIGEICTLLYSSHHLTNGLITFENSTNIFYSQWVKSKTSTKSIKLRITEDMLPGMYISFLPDNCAVNTPIYKYIPINYSNDSSWVGLEIDIPYDWSARSKIPIKISNNNNNTLNYYIHITPFDTSRNIKLTANNFFNQQHPYIVKTWSPYSIINSNKVMDLTYSINNNISYSAPNNTQLLLGPFTIAELEKATHYIDVPNVQGLINVNVVGINNKTGRTFEIEKNAEIHEDISITTNLPKYVNGGDNLELQFEVHNNELVADTILIEVKDLTSFEILSNPERFIIIEKDSSVYFTIIVQAKSRVGKGEFTIKSNSNKSSASKKISIPIQSNPIYINSSISAILHPQLTWQQTIIPIGVKGTNTATIEVSDTYIPSIMQIVKSLEKNSSHSLSYIINKNFPLIYLNNAIEDEKKIRQFTKSINDALMLLMQYQTVKGGFVNKLADNQPNMWLTSYVGEFMLEAKLNGYIMNEGVFNKWLRFQQRELHKMGFASNRGCYKQAYQLYTLAKSGFIQTEYLDDYSCYLSGELSEKYYLAMAYIELDKKKQAILLVNCDSIIQEVHTLNIIETALLLNTSNKLNLSDLSTILVNRLNDLIKDINNSPNEIAITLNSILQNIYSLKENSNIRLNYQINHGKNIQFINSSSLSYLNIPLEFTLSKNIDIVNNGFDNVYLSILNCGSPKAIVDHYLKSDRLTIQNQYFNLDNTSINMNNIRVGSFYKQVIKYKNRDKNIKQELSISIPISSGVELVYSNVPILFNANQNKTDDLLKTELTVEPLNSKEIILIYKSLFKGSFTSFPIKTYNTNKFYFEKYTGQSELHIN